MDAMIILKTDGSTETIPMSATPGLEALQKGVGGYIELVPYFTELRGEPCQVFCNEEGKLHSLPTNINATILWQQQCSTVDVLVGDVVILLGAAMDTGE